MDNNKQSESLISYFGHIDKEFRGAKRLSLVCIACAAAVAVGSTALALSFARDSRSEVYVVDRGSATLARRGLGESEKHDEITDHVGRFHELFFNLAPSNESIKRNIDRALLMSDRSAYDYYQDLSERGFYSRLVSANISQYIDIDSVKVDMASYPYDVRTYGTLMILRESNITAYQFESSCRVIDTERSPSNPHGLMMEKFAVTRNENIGTRKRN